MFKLINQINKINKLNKLNQLNQLNQINKLGRSCTSTGLKNSHFNNKSNKSNKSKIPIIQTKKYINEYEWLCNENGVFKLGITHKALEEFNEIVYVEQLYNIGDIVESGDELCAIESVKASDSLDAPFICDVIDINESFDDCLENINNNPECEKTSWFVKIKKIHDC